MHEGKGVQGGKQGEGVGKKRITVWVGLRHREKDKLRGERLRVSGGQGDCGRLERGAGDA